MAVLVGFFISQKYDEARKKKSRFGGFTLVDENCSPSSFWLQRRSYLHMFNEAFDQANKEAPTKALQKAEILPPRY